MENIFFLSSIIGIHLSGTPELDHILLGLNFNAKMHFDMSHHFVPSKKWASCFKLTKQTFMIMLLGSSKKFDSAACAPPIENSKL